ncbi:helix-turn-helix domain-containing protein [Marinifilum caeruleilacunae]|uniref:DNA-binding protein n=1 Tax=Marinifilum caeruleilacunae TaxID=2499076 RepID=A0ABX1X1H0_9BACT|nr:helix-turn-helix domain-containing protein [Marinifilum caeruleilacunae]NOU62265.1 DNA-binding protein [Marinifilum caeruleilacunae]
MTSKLEIEKTCLWCKETFVARTTSTKYCSHKCNGRAYKEQKRHEKIQKHLHQVPKISDPTLDILNTKEFLKVSEVSTLLGLSRQTIYNLIYSGQLKASKISPRITIIKRSDIDEMFKNAKPAEINPTKITKEDEKFYTVDEIKKKFNVGESWLYRILREKQIPKIKRFKKAYYSKTHVDKHFKKFNYSSLNDIKDWATIEELCEELNTTHAAIWTFVSTNGIPKKRDGRKKLYSRQHVLIAKGLAGQEEPEYYTTEEATEKFNISRDSLYGLLKTYNITRIKEGRYIKISKMELDNLLNPKNRIP